MTSYDLKTDSDLIALLQAGDEIAFTEIFNRYNKLLYSHVYNKIRDEDAARDLVQDVFVTLWEKRNHVENLNLAGYLFTIIRNRLLNLLSHQKIVSDYASSIQNYVQQKPEMADELIREKQLAALIDTEINALPPRMREVFILSRYQHLSNKEIAATLGLSEHTVADQIKKSLKTLRHKIGLSVLIGCLSSPHFNFLTDADAGDNSGTAQIVKNLNFFFEGNPR